MLLARTAARSFPARTFALRAMSTSRPLGAAINTVTVFGVSSNERRARGTGRAGKTD
jgi:hypothetical protein